jgi:hypothetical protein
VTTPHGPEGANGPTRRTGPLPAWSWFGLLVLVLAAGLAGPRVQVDGAFRPPALGADLDAEIDAGEAALAVDPAVARRIVWRQPATRDVTPLAVVYLHGFSATHRETAPLAEHVAAALGANLYLARLSGHGLDGPALGAASANEWVADADRAMAIGSRIGRRVVLIGVSTGATLALLLNARPQWRDAIAATVLISPNLRPKAAGVGLLGGPWGRQIAWIGTGGENSFEPVNADHARYWTTRHPSRVLAEMMGLVAHVWTLEPLWVSRPALVFYSPRDTVVSAELIAATCAQASAWRCDVVTDASDPSQHVLAGDILSPNTTASTVATIVAYVDALAVSR